MLKYTPLSLWGLYLKSGSLQFGVAHARAHVPAVLRLLERRIVDPMLLKPLVGSWHDAEHILLEPATKVIVQRSRLATGPRKI